MLEEPFTGLFDEKIAAGTISVPYLYAPEGVVVVPTEVNFNAHRTADGSSPIGMEGMLFGTTGTFLHFPPRGYIVSFFRLIDAHHSSSYQMV